MRREPPKFDRSLLCPDALDSPVRGVQEPEAAGNGAAGEPPTDSAFVSHETPAPPRVPYRKYPKNPVMTDRSPFDTHPDGSEWPDAERDDVQSRRKKNKPLKLGSTANPKKKPADLESKTRELLRGMGFVYGKTEQYNAYTGQRKDLFGCIDGVAVKESTVWFVQTCRRADYAAHLRKMATGTFKIGNGKPTEAYYATRHLAKKAWSKPSESGRDVALIMVVWDQPDGPGSKWRHEVRRVTLADLEACRERARKK